MPQKPSRATVRGHSPIPPGTPAQKIEGDLCQGTNFENLIPKFGSRYVRYIEETLQYQKQSISGYHLQVETVLEKRSLRKFVGSIFSEQHCRKCTTRLLHYIQVAITISESHVVKHSWKSGPTMLSIILCTTLHSEKVSAKALHLSVLRDVVARRSRGEKCDLRRNKIYAKEPKNIQVESGCKILLRPSCLAINWSLLNTSCRVSVWIQTASEHGKFHPWDPTVSKLSKLTPQSMINVETCWNMLKLNWSSLDIATLT